MRTQKVHFLTYLVKNSIDFTNPQELALVALPANAEVTHISFSVEEAADAGFKADIGFIDEPDALASDIDISKAEANILSKIFTTPQVQEIAVSIKPAVGDTPATKGRGTLRVIYYLPSTTMMEF
ncbi:hypothetical protein LS68_009220 [Helicobacter sp. MIT 05-5293]|uniref:hypothetical protein n=1 Tax=unclassified Helicobacter TaxID=2593540 RepID=UPI00051E0DE5|nr:MULTISPECIES: hypothetical protein [unclassified Helicobacter]TLD79842.1 hypothetical protein LS68_009220 [Helicobacter sp. MIT 05-5293]TLD85441.1 hypothetical protein LS69_009560 [Helicobacter sp. MIT 05-5294]